MIVGTIILSVGSLAGGYNAVVQHARSVIPALVQGVLSLLNGTAAIGKGVADYGRFGAEGDLKSIEGKLDSIQRREKEDLHPYFFI